MASNVNDAILLMLLQTISRSKKSTLKFLQASAVVNNTILWNELQG